MKLTCVTATFNAIKSGNRDRLIRCIESVGNLKTEHEHLIYDGASTDGTVELLRELEAKTSGIKVVSERDTGIYNALNKGVRDAKGEWFYVLGCDDWISSPNQLDKLLVDNLTTIDAVVSPVNTTEGESDPEMQPLRMAAILWHTPYCHQGLLVKTRIIRAFGGFDEQYRICADYDLVLKLHLSGCKIIYRNNVFAEYRRGGFSTACNPETDHVRILESHLGLPSNHLWRHSPCEAIPLSYACRYLFHKDHAVRLSARCMAWRTVKPTLRIVVYPFVVMTRGYRHKGCGK